MHRAVVLGVEHQVSVRIWVTDVSRTVTIEVRLIWIGHLEAVVVHVVHPIAIRVEGASVTD